MAQGVPDRAEWTQELEVKKKKKNSTLSLLTLELEQVGIQPNLAIRIAWNQDNVQFPLHFILIQYLYTSIYLITTIA